MVEGLQIDVKSSELKKILAERLGYHEDKARVYAGKRDTMAAQLRAIEDEMEVGKVTGGTPLQAMDSKVREHNNQAAYYRFMLDHVVVNDVYRLGQDDLRRLGIMPDRY